MAIQLKWTMVFVALWVIGCAHGPRSFVPIGGAPSDAPSQVAQIVEDEDYPALLRGLDGEMLHSMRVPSDIWKYAYLLQPGPHLLWVMNMPYGHPLIPQRIRCYVIRAELEPGVCYRLVEDPRAQRALLLKEGTQETVASGPMVDHPWVFLRGCRWQ